MKLFPNRMLTAHWSFVLMEPATNLIRMYVNQLPILDHHQPHFRVMIELECCPIYFTPKEG